METTQQHRARMIKIRDDFRESYDRYVQGRPHTYGEGTNGRTIKHAVDEYRRVNGERAEPMFTREAWQLISKARYKTDEEVAAERERYRQEERKRLEQSIIDKCFGYNRKGEIVKTAIRYVEMNPDMDHWNAVNLAAAAIKKRYGGQ